LAEVVGGCRGEAAEVPMVVGRQRRGAFRLQTVGPGGGARFRRQGEAVDRDHAERLALRLRPDALADRLVGPGLL
jgi:hypothetical protein